MTVRIHVYCGCPEVVDPSQRIEAELMDDVEDGTTGEYRCPSCERTIMVELAVSNEG